MNYRAYMKICSRSEWFDSEGQILKYMLWHDIFAPLSMSCHVKEYRILKTWKRKEYDLWSSEGPMLKYMNISMPLACHVMLRNIDIWNLKKGMIWSTLFWGDDVCKIIWLDMTFLCPVACHVMSRNINIWTLKKGMIWSTNLWGADVKVYSKTWHFYSP